MFHRPYSGRGVGGSLKPSYPLYRKVTINQCFLFSALIWYWLSPYVKIRSFQLWPAPTKPKQRQKIFFSDLLIKCRNYKLWNVKLHVIIAQSFTPERSLFLFKPTLFSIDLWYIPYLLKSSVNFVWVLWELVTICKFRVYDQKSICAKILSHNKIGIST